MKVILSHPFSGAVYWWFGHLQGVQGVQALRKPPGGYYGTIYGDVDSYIDIALACLVIFDEVILPAADVAFPGERHSESIWTVGELGVETDWAPLLEASSIYDLAEADLMNDAVIKRVLRRVPKSAWSTILNYTISDLILSYQQDAPVICSPGRKVLIDRLIALGIVQNLRRHETNLGDSREISLSVEQYVTTAGLIFNAENVASLASIKWHERIRSYADEFQKVLVGLSSEPLLGTLYEKVAEAWTTADSNKEIASAFSAASRSFAVAGLIPVAGTVFGALSVAADASSIVVDRRNERYRWYELGPEISRYQSLRSLEVALKERNLM